MTASHIVFDRVWKKFHRGQFHDSLRDVIPALTRRLLGKVSNDRELEEDDFWAVRDLSFEVLPGKCLGIIGPNGSGKSTTLKLLTRILAPTRGHCELRGRVGSLIEVSAGFHGDLTGRENVFLQGAIMGMRREEIARRFDEIVAFSGISEFIDTPVKRYSSGMNARLGFSIAAHLEPDVLIVDEVLSVGDMSFQAHAFGRIRELATSGIPVVIVSHQLERVADLCTDAILLNRGQVAARGTPAEAISAYVKQADALRETKSTGEVLFDEVTLGQEYVVSGQPFTVRARGRMQVGPGRDIDPFRVRVRSLMTGSVVYATGTRLLGASIAPDGAFDITITLQANVAPGSYLIEVGAQDLALRSDVATVDSQILWVTDAGRSLGSAQLNASLSVAEPAVR